MKTRFVAMVAWDSMALWNFLVYSHQPEKCSNFARDVRSHALTDTLTSCRVCYWGLMVESKKEMTWC
jgi:hypothetical protein